MTTQKHARHLALSVAVELLVLLGSSTERIEIMGSIRRRKDYVKDIELLAIPRMVQPLPDMFGDFTGEPTNLLDLAMESMVSQGTILAKRPNKDGKFNYGPKNKLLVHVPTQIPVDLFSTTAEHWGMAAVVRTGPKEFNVALMERFRDLGMRGHAYRGVTDDKGKHHSCPTEESVFSHAQWRYVPPEERADWAWPHTASNIHIQDCAGPGCGATCGCGCHIGELR